MLVQLHSTNFQLELDLVIEQACLLLSSIFYLLKYKDSVEYLPNFFWTFTGIPIKWVFFASVNITDKAVWNVYINGDLVKCSLSQRHTIKERIFVISLLSTSHLI